jgi:hypothetical protein
MALPALEQQKDQGRKKGLTGTGQPAGKRSCVGLLVQVEGTGGVQEAPAQHAQAQGGRLAR